MLFFNLIYRLLLLQASKSEIRAISLVQTDRQVEKRKRRGRGSEICLFRKLNLNVIYEVTLFTICQNMVEQPKQQVILKFGQIYRSENELATLRCGAF